MYKNQNSQGRKGAISVKRSGQARLGLDNLDKPFYLPDIKANYSEYSKNEDTYIIPKSLKEFRKYSIKRNYQNSKTDKSQDPAQKYNRFKTPIKNSKIL